MRNHRLFVALRVTRELTDQVRRFHDMYGDLDVRWINERDLHLTLVPPWQEDDIEDVKEQLDGLEGFGEVEVFFDDYVLAPETNPYMIWLKADNDGRLESLKNRCENVLDLEPEAREFRPHMTVARFAEGVEIPSIDMSSDLLVTFDSLVLMESHLTDQRGEYEILHEVVL